MKPNLLNCFVAIVLFSVTRFTSYFANHQLEKGLTNAVHVEQEVPITAIKERKSKTFFQLKAIQPKNNLQNERYKKIAFM